MYEIEFYSTKNGKIPVKEYVDDLRKNNTKDSRIRIEKIYAYIESLSIHGKQLNNIYMKHLNGEIWELRPTKDRILFAGLYNGKFVLLHAFTKKTQKTPKYEIDKAKKEFKDYVLRSEKNEE